MKYLFKKLVGIIKTNTKYVCEQCGWTTQKTKTTDKLKAHCNHCGCNS